MDGGDLGDTKDEQKIVNQISPSSKPDDRNSGKWVDGVLYLDFARNACDIVWGWLARVVCFNVRSRVSTRKCFDSHQQGDERQCRELSEGRVMTTAQCSTRYERTTRTKRADERDLGMYW